jgi:hypothetical protein
MRKRREVLHCRYNPDSEDFPRVHPRTKVTMELLPEKPHEELDDVSLIYLWIYLLTGKDLT